MIRVIFVNFCERVTFVILEICKDFVSKYYCFVQALFVTKYTTS